MTTRPEERGEPEPLRELTLGRSPPTTGDPRSRPSALGLPPDSGDGTHELEARCRRKAEAARWASARQRQIREGHGAADAGAPADPDMVEWAERLTDGYYWAAANDAAQAADITWLDDVGGCFEAVAEALSLVSDAEERPKAVERALPLLAEAQSALRRALQRLQTPDDPEQLDAYERAREAAARHRVFLKRHMRADDLADPARWPDLLTRIGALTGSDPQSREHRRRIERLRQQVQRIGHDPGPEPDWRAIVDAVDGLVGAGVPPSDRRVRDLLLPVVDELPELGDLPPGFRLVLREIDRYLATRPPAPAQATAPEPTAEVREVAGLLAGRSAVLIGGDRRPEAQEALVRSLGLRELAWIETKDHQPVSAFEPAIARPEVALVLLAIRWSSHAFGNVRHDCERLGKPLVRLPGGYGVNQVAAQVLAQCGERLRG